MEGQLDILPSVCNVSGQGLSASYTTLITWLLSLVPSNFTYLQQTGTDTQLPWILPFYVIGLQQALMDGQLCLMVAVTPVEQFDAKHVMGKSKKNKVNLFIISLFGVKHFCNITIFSIFH